MNATLEHHDQISAAGFIVIYESFYWKRDLAKRAKYIDGKKQKKNWSEEALARLEQEVMLGFYSIRKLYEARKIEGKAFNRGIKLMCFQSTGEAPTHSNWVELNRFYNLSDGKAIERPLNFVTNQIIHSFIFVVAYSLDHKGLQAIAFNSDKTKKNALYTINISELVDCFYYIAGEYTKKESIVDDDTGEITHYVGD